MKRLINNKNKNKLISLKLKIKFKNKIKKDNFKKNKLIIDQNENYNNQNNIIPNYITHLLFSNLFNSPLEDLKLPKSIVSINFIENCKFNQTITKNSFKNIRNLKTLKFGDNFTNNGNVIEPFSIPSSVTNLDLGMYNSNLEIGSIPNSVIKLQLGELFNKSLGDGGGGGGAVGCTTSSLGNNIKTLILSEQFNQIINKNSLPNSIIELVFGSFFNQTLIPFSIPSNCKSIFFGTSFNNNNQPISPNIFPNSIEKIVFNRSFNQPFLPNSIKSTVKEIYFSSNYPKEYIINLPKTIKIYFS